jgi:NAD(P)-dependent dehydrogenase (short-subunit alcohol dehydrogenase family)
MSPTAAGRFEGKDMNKIDLSGRVAVVTGGAQGFGRAIAERFVASGARVAIWDVDQVFAQRTANELGNGTKSYGLDVSDLPSVERARDATIKDFGKIDILVNNAGIAGVNATVWDTTIDEWRRVMRINLDGPFICSKAIVPHMIAQKYGRIVNIASIAGKEGNPNAAHYSASKAGVIALTKSLGKELAGYDIAVNAVTPAAAKTAIFDQITQQHIDFMLSKIPRARFVLVEELAALVAWIASEDNSFTTGAVFDISGSHAAKPLPWLELLRSARGAGGGIRSLPVLRRDRRIRRARLQATHHPQRHPGRHSDHRAATARGRPENEEPNNRPGHSRRSRCGNPLRRRHDRGERKANYPARHAAAARRRAVRKTAGRPLGLRVAGACRASQFRSRQATQLRDRRRASGRRGGALLSREDRSVGMDTRGGLGIVRCVVERTGAHEDRRRCETKITRYLGEGFATGRRPAVTPSR